MKRVKAVVNCNLKGGEEFYPRGTNWECDFAELPEIIQLEVTENAGTVDIIELPDPKPDPILTKVPKKTTKTGTTSKPKTKPKTEKKVKAPKKVSPRKIKKKTS